MTQQPPYPGGLQGPQGPQVTQGPQYYGPPPKKKTHKFRNFIVLPFLAFIVLIVVIVAASGGDSGTSPGTATDDATTKSAAAPEDRGQPRPVTVGKAFTIGKHRLDNGWKLTHQEYIGSQVTGTVTNVSKDTSTAIFHIKFLKGNTVVGNMQCTTNDLEPGQSEAVECLNTVTGAANIAGKYDKVTAEATF